MVVITCLCPYLNVWVCNCACVCLRVFVQSCVCVREWECVHRVVRVNKLLAAGTHVALLSELREKTNCFFLSGLIHTTLLPFLSDPPHTVPYPTAPNSTHGSNRRIIFSTLAFHPGILIWCSNEAVLSTLWCEWNFYSVTGVSSVSGQFHRVWLRPKQTNTLWCFLNTAIVQGSTIWMTVV